MSQHSAPLVGMHFRPPAKCILAVLPSGCRLSIVPEPSNPYDENALAVFVASRDIPAEGHEQLSAEAPLSGFDLSDILAQEAWQLGYISAKDGSAAAWRPKIVAMIETAPIEANITDARGFLAFDAKGAPLVRADLS